MQVTYSRKAQDARMDLPLDFHAGEIRATRNALRYGFACGKIAARAGRAVNPATIMRLFDAQSLGTCIKLLQSTPYYSYLRKARSLGDIQQGFACAVDDAIDMALKVGLDEVFSDFFRLDRKYAPGYGHSYFADRLELAFQTEIPFVVQMVRLEVDCGNVRLLMRKRFAQVSADALFGPSNDEVVLVKGGATSPAFLEQAYYGTKDARGLAEAMVTTTAFRSLDSSILADVYTLDLGLRMVTERFVNKGVRAGIGPERVVAYVEQVKAEATLLQALIVGLESGVDKDVLRRSLVTGQ